MTQGSLGTRVSLSPWKRVMLLRNVPAETVDSAVSSVKNSKLIFQLSVHERQSGSKK